MELVGPVIEGQTGAISEARVTLKRVNWKSSASEQKVARCDPVEALQGDFEKNNEEGKIEKPPQSCESFGLDTA
jgi:hypothetical protein